MLKIWFSGKSWNGCRLGEDGQQLRQNWHKHSSQGESTFFKWVIKSGQYKTVQLQCQCNVAQLRWFVYKTWKSLRIYPCFAMNKEANYLFWTLTRVLHIYHDQFNLSLYLGTKRIRRTRKLPKCCWFNNERFLIFRSVILKITRLVFGDPVIPGFSAYYFWAELFCLSSSYLNLPNFIGSWKNG